MIAGMNIRMCFGSKKLVQGAELVCQEIAACLPEVHDVMVYSMNGRDFEVVTPLVRCDLQIDPARLRRMVKDLDHGRAEFRERYAKPCASFIASRTIGQGLVGFRTDIPNDALSGYRILS